MISSILATYRPELVPQAISMWRAQDYSNKELIVVQNEDQAPATIPMDITSIIVPKGTSLGSKINVGIAASHGELLHKWDDDDLYAPGFLARGVKALRFGTCDFCTWSRHFIQFPDETRFIIWFGVGGSAIFTRRLAAKCPYRDAPMNIDTFLVEDFKRAGFKYTEVADSPTLFTYVRHAGNIWKVARGGVPADQHLKQYSSPWSSVWPKVLNSNGDR